MSLSGISTNNEVKKYMRKLVLSSDNYIEEKYKSKKNKNFITNGINLIKFYRRILFNVSFNHTLQ